MADHIADTVVDHLVGHRYRLFRVTGIVVFHTNQLIALDATLGIDIGNCLTGTGKLHIAILCDRAGHRPDDRHLNVFCHCRMPDCHRDTASQQCLTFC
ncbi:hypothetical protein D3C80_1993500 [compost metagenome]